MSYSFAPDFIEREKENKPLRYYDKTYNPEGRVVFFANSELINETDVLEQLRWARSRFKSETGSELESVVVDTKVWKKIKQRMVQLGSISSMDQAVSEIIDTGPYGAINFMCNIYGINIFMPITFADD